MLEAGQPTGDVVVDMEAGLEHLSRGTTRHVDTLLAIAEPYYRSMETARRVFELAAELEIARVLLVANKVRDEADADAIAEYAERHGLLQGASVPWDAAVAEADRVARPLIDVAPPGAPALVAIDRMTEALIA